MKALMVGAGAVADRWLRVLRADGRLTLCGIVDPNLGAARSLCDRHDVEAPCYPSLPAALQAVTAEVAINLTPPTQHVRVTRAALDAGMHVLTEKPLATTLADGWSLTKLADRRGVLLAVMRNRGNDPDLLAFRDLLLTSKITPPYLVTASVAVRLRTAGFRTMTPLPATTDLAIHGFDQVQLLITARPLQITCTESATGFLGEHSSTATMAVSFADGSVFSYRCGFTSSTLPTSGNGQWRVEAAQGTGLWAGGDSATIANASGSTAFTFPQHEPSYRTSIISMLDTLLGADPHPSAEPAFRSIALLDAAFGSITVQGRAVEVEPLWVPG